ncbi:ABC transporter permease [Oceanobacillus sp. CAU 1775]
MKKDLLVFWRDRKEVLISVLSPILLIIVLNFIFSGVTFDDAGEMDLNVGIVFEDEESLGVQQFAESLQDMGLSEVEIEGMLTQAESLLPNEFIHSLFNNPELSSWIHTEELSEKVAVEKIEDNALDAIIKIPAGYTYDVLNQVLLQEKADTAIRVQIEEYSIETEILANIIGNFMETVNFQLALGTLTGIDAVEAELPQGGREIINENIVEIDLAQYFTVAMSTLFAMFIAITVATKTETEKRERVFNRILLTNRRPLSYLMGKVISTFCFVWLQLMIIFVTTDLFLGIFPNKSADFWLGIIVIVTLFSLTIAGLSTIFTSVILRVQNVNTANGVFMVVIIGFAALGGNFFPMEQLPSWIQGLSNWTPNGITVTAFTDFLQHSESISFAPVALKQFGFFALFLLIGISLFPERGRA